jgi:hypothetical protein
MVTGGGALLKGRTARKITETYQRIVNNCSHRG